jgi:uncharacterized protein (TIGR02118 family)
MFKLVAIYKVPSDIENFEKHYEEIHTPLTMKIPKMKEFRLNRVFGSPTGKSDLHMMAEICFASKDDFKSGMGTKEAMESGKDAFKFAGDIVSIHFVEETVTPC